MRDQKALSTVVKSPSILNLPAEEERNLLILVGFAAIASAVLIFWFSQSAPLAAGFSAMVLALAALVIFARKLFPAAAGIEQDMDWSLTRHGYEVITATNGEEGLEILKGRSDIDMLVSDVVMPMMDGPTLGRHARELYPKMPLLFMSGYAEEQLRRSIALDNVDFLPKPFSVQQLAEAVRNAMAA